MKHFLTPLKVLILFIFLFGIQEHTFAQAWRNNLPNKEKSQLTFFDYQKAFNDYWAPYNVVEGYYINNNGEKVKAQGWKQFKRWEWYWKTRVDNKTGAFPNTNAFIEWEKFSKNNPSSKSQLGAWVELGPANLDRQDEGALQENGTGRLNCMAFDPNDDNHFWVGAPAGGVWETTDGGSTWACITDDIPVIGVSAIALPSDYNKTSNPTIYIGSGDRDAVDDPSIGVLKTTDGGATWSTTGLTFGASENTRVGGLVCSESDPNTIVAATFKGIYKSNDGGTSWTNLQSGYFIDMDKIPGTNTIIATTISTVQAWRSTDFGSTWTNVWTGTPGAGGEYRCDVATTGADANVVYLITDYYDTSSIYGIYKSTDGGLTFIQVYDGLTQNNIYGWTTSDTEADGGQGWYDCAIAVSNTNADVVYVGGVNGWISIDGASSFTNCNIWHGSYSSADVVHADHHNAYFRPSDNRLFDVNDGGVYYCDNVTSGLTSTWLEITDGIVTGQLYDIGISQSVEGYIVAGFQDNGTKLMEPTDDKYGWQQVKGGDGMCCAIDPIDVNRQWGTYVQLQVDRTLNLWGSASSIRNSGAAAWAGPLEVDPQGTSLYIGTDAVEWDAAKDGSKPPGSFSDLSQSLDATNYLSALDIFNDGTNKMIWTASPSGCWKSPLGGSGTYTLLSNLPGNAVTDIAIDEHDYNHVYVCFGSYDNTNVWETSDGGTNWTDISAGLPAVPTGAIVINETNTTEHEVYVGTDAGIYVKLGSAPWQLFNQGMPFVSITDLEVYYGGATPSIYVSTYGRGIWKGDCYEPPALDLAIGEIVVPVEEYCALGTYIPTITISNIGTTTITSATVQYSIDGGAPVSQNWSGSLIRGASTNVTFPAVALTYGTHTFDAEISNPNGTDPDENETNDVASKTYSVWDNSMPYTQTFDAFPLGGNTNNYDGGTVALSECWVNETSDDIDWSVNSGVSPSGGTGPTGDHTSGSGVYLYTESSGPNGNKNLKASSPTLDLTNYTGCSVSFWYHMYGANMGSLQIDLYYGGTNHAAVPVTWGSTGSTTTSISGDQGDQWYEATVDISAADGTNDFVFTFNATTGADYLSEMAIDDFNVTGTPLVVCTPPTTQASNISFSSIGETSMSVSWSKGNGDRVIVLASTSPIATDPSSGTSYTANSVYGLGDAIGSAFVVHDANNNTNNVTVTGLNANTTYYFAVYEYMITDVCYLIPGLTGNQITLPAQPTAITGNDPVCEGASEIYTVPDITGVTETWSFPAGWTITAGQGTNSVTVTVGTTGGTITCTPSNTAGDGTAQTLAVTVNALPTAPTTVDATVNPICVGDNTNLTYTGGSGTTFNWYSSSCGVGLVGSGNNLTVSPGATIIYYGRWENTCGASACLSVTVTVNDVPAQPSAITGNATPNQGASETYSVTNVGGVTYTWTVPGDWTIDAGQGTNSINVTVGANSGNVTVTPSNSCGDGTPQTLAVTPVVGTIAWDGSTDSDWQTTTNWTPEQIPTSTDNVLIANGCPNYPVIDDGATVAVCNDITIENTSNVVIAVNGRMTVSGSITNSAGNTGLIINSDASGTGSLIHNTSGGVDATVNSFLSAVSNQWHMVGSQIASAPVSVFPSTNNLYSYNESVDDYWTGTNYDSPVNGWAPFNSGNMALNTGYLFNYYQTTLNYTGTLNDNTTTNSISIVYTDNGVTAPNLTDYNAFDGWNFISNPYTASIYWDEATINHAGANLDDAVYYYDGANSQYAGWSSGASVNGGTAYIPAGQGFFVKANAAGTLNIPPAAIVHNSQVLWKTVPDNLIKLRIEGNNIYDETVVRFVSDATFTHDANYDAYKLFSHGINIFQIYTKDAENIEYSINAVPDNWTENITIPVKLIYVPDNFTINISEYTLSGINVYLKDNIENTLTKLELNSSLNFVSSESDLDRFELVFEKSPENVTDVLNTVKVMPNPNKGTFTVIFAEVNNISNIQIINALGQEVFSNNKIENNTEINLSNKAKGIYFLKVKFKDNTVINKKVIID